MSALKKLTCGLWGFHLQIYDRVGHSLMIFYSPLELTLSSPVDCSTALLRFLFPSALNNLSLLASGLPHPICSTSRFSQPPDGFLLKLFCGLISCHWHSWDLLFRVFPLKAAPHPHRKRLPVDLRTFYLPWKTRRLSEENC